MFALCLYFLYRKLLTSRKNPCMCVNTLGNKALSDSEIASTIHLLRVCLDTGEPLLGDPKQITHQISSTAPPSLDPEKEEDRKPGRL